MNKRTFEREVPDGYELRKHINANSKRIGLVFNLVSIALCAVVIFVSLAIFKIFESSPNPIFVFIGVFAGIVLMLAYMVLHELVHGIAYKISTGERLKFGISWSCAYCGVPNIYVYRKYALLAVLAPVVLFTVIFMPLMVLCILLTGGCRSEIATASYYALSVLLGMNIGGSAGDFYLAFLLLFKIKGKDTLIRDTGPEQYIYVRDFYENEKKEEWSGEA